MPPVAITLRATQSLIEAMYLRRASLLVIDCGLSSACPHHLRDPWRACCTHGELIISSLYGAHLRTTTAFISQPCLPSSSHVLAVPLPATMPHTLYRRVAVDFVVGVNHRLRPYNFMLSVPCLRMDCARSGFLGLAYDLKLGL